MSKRYLSAAYHDFTPTGNDAVDAILEAVACAGKAYHNTSQWDEPAEYGNDGGPSHWDAIQAAANKAARPEALPTEEAIKLGQAACTLYVDWYNHGHSHEAGRIAYDLVSYIRSMLNYLTKPQVERS